MTQALAGPMSPQWRLLPCQPRDGINKTGNWGFGKAANDLGKRQWTDILHRPRNYTDISSVREERYLTGNKGAHCLWTRAPAIYVGV